MINKVIYKVKSYLKLHKEKKLLKKLNLEETNLIASIKDKNLTYLSRARLANIVYTINSTNESKVKGMFIEAGCALGGSSILISKLKSTNSVLNVFDVFGMIPSPTVEDTQDVHNRYKKIVEGKSSGLGGELYYGYENNLYDKVINSFKSFNVYPDKENVNLIEGLVQETMVITEPVVFAHIDVDWYDPVKTCLQQIWPNLVKGGSLILDDYHDWGGCRKATDEYFRNFVGEFSTDDSYGSMKITRIK